MFVYFVCLLVCLFVCLLVCLFVCFFVCVLVLLLLFVCVFVYGAIPCFLRHVPGAPWRARGDWFWGPGANFSWIVVNPRTPSYKGTRGDLSLVLGAIFLDTSEPKDALTQGQTGPLSGFHLNVSGAATETPPGPAHWTHQQLLKRLHLHLGIPSSVRKIKNCQQ